MAEEHVNEASAFGEEDAKTRSGMSGYRLQDHSVIGNFKFVKPLKLILERLWKGSAFFNRVQCVA